MGNKCYWGGGAEDDGGDFYGDCMGRKIDEQGEIFNEDQLEVTDMY